MIRINTKNYVNVRLNNMNFLSMHDIRYEKIDLWINDREKTLNEYIIEKYIRRYHQLIDKIKNNFVILLCSSAENYDQKKILYDILKNYSNKFVIIFLENNNNDNLLITHPEINSYTINLYKITLSNHLTRHLVIDFEKIESIFEKIYYDNYILKY